MSRQAALGTCSVPLLASLSFMLLLGACSSLVVETTYTKIAPAVVELLNEEREVHVLISLSPPEGFNEPGTDPEAMRAEIARIQQGVLDALGTEAYRNRVRFETVPALAGTVLESSALDTLDQHADVVDVSLDAGGTGTGGGGG